jgi:hypothetical protein
MSDDKKLREFWIRDQGELDRIEPNDYQEVLIYIDKQTDNKFSKHVHVIEKSAYDALQKENRRLSLEFGRKILDYEREIAALQKKLADLKKWCPCGGVILADTEDWPVPLCNACYEFVCKEVKNETT